MTAEVRWQGKRWEAHTAKSGHSTYSALVHRTSLGRELGNGTPHTVQCLHHRSGSSRGKATKNTHRKCALNNHIEDGQRQCPDDVEIGTAELQRAVLKDMGNLSVHTRWFANSMNRDKRTSM